MNYLILTPDGVGSTLLQRLITTTLYLENHSVINTHELTNGLELKNGIAIKNFSLEYSQSLDEITNIIKISDFDTSMVSRLAKYHLDTRKDDEKDCKRFYQFLNKHFQKKIMCVRENIFEYAMSWSIRNKSGIVNIYDQHDRDKVSQVDKVDEDVFVKMCNDYIKYMAWIDDNFPGVQKVSYESMVKDSDTVMQKITGHQSTFINKLGLKLSAIIMMEYNFLKKNNAGALLKKEEKKLLAKYRLVCKEMINKNVIIGVPLKNTTLMEKKNQIKNFDNCLDKFYNFAKNYNWIDQSKATYDFWNDRYIC
jgi:hypothetical protein